MGVLRDGRWESVATYADERSGEFVRQASRFRQRVTADGSSGFKAEPGRYHLYARSSSSRA
jgi:putative glutathione S-transferase